jgi:hypothetical protein
MASDDSQMSSKFIYNQTKYHIHMERNESAILFLLAILNTTRRASNLSRPTHTPVSRQFPSLLK